MSWTFVPKPVSSVWTSVNPQGKEQYDQSSLTYDDASTFYDGVNQFEWTNVAKPNTSAWTNVNKPT